MLCMKPLSHLYHSRYFWWVVLTLATVFLVVTQYETFARSVHTLTQAHRPDIVAALMLSLSTCALAALTYKLLALRKVAYLPTLTVQAASMFVDRIVPAGLGAIGLNYHYLRKHRLSFAQASSTVLMNNMLGTIGHLCVLLMALLLSGMQLPLPTTRTRINGGAILLACLGIVVLGALLVLRRHLPGLRKRLLAMTRQLAAFRRRPANIFAALISSMLLTLANVTALYLCCAALGLPVAFVTVLLVFSLGVVLGAATPTPGGLGGTEAGIVAGLLTYGLAPAHAIAAVLLFRLCNFWAPMLVGVVALFIARSKRFI